MRVNLKARNDKFRVQLRDNPFVCNCTLSDFYRFLMSNESEGIVEDKWRLACSYEGSFTPASGRRIIDSQLHRLCGFSLDYPTSRFPTPSFYPTYHWTTTRKSILPVTVNKQPHHSSQKLILFMFACLLVSGLIAFVLKV